MRFWVAVQNMKISLITVCHKSKKDIEGYVSSFLKLHHPKKEGVEYEFVFVENSTQPELREAVQPLSESGFDVLVIDSKNEGFGTGCNLGARHSTGDLFVFVNPDVRFLSCLRPLVESARKAPWGTVRQLTTNGKMHALDLFPEHKNLIYELVRGYLFVNKYWGVFRKKLYVVGSFLVVDRKTFNNSGGFNQAFFLYYEETELCRRLHKISGPPFVEQSVVVVHEGFGSQESLGHTLKYEAQGFITYCHITSQINLISTRIRQLWILGLFSKTAKQRYLLLKELCAKSPL
jgi:hypothetical protein